MVSCPDDEPAAPGRSAGVFLTTHWSVVVKAGDSQSPEAASAMERLCQDYWYPLYAFARRKGHGHEDACDLTQAFFAAFLEKRYLRSVDSNLGRFRTFLLTSMTHFLANEWGRRRTQRRGGGRPPVSLDETADQRFNLEPAGPLTPEKIYDRRWAETMMELVLKRLALETNPQRFEVLKGFLLEDNGMVSYDEASARLNLSVAAITSAIHRLRARFRSLLFEEVANTVRTPADVEPEMRHLLGSLVD